MEFQIKLDRTDSVKLSQQITRTIREAILTRQLKAGNKLPPTRDLAQRLQVSRMVVVEAYECLAADGYIETIPGSGTFITSRIKPSQNVAEHFSEPKRRTDILPDKPVSINFRPGLPALDLFPRQVWKKSLSKALCHTDNDLLGYGPVEGLPRLRQLIANYVARSRGLPVAAEQVIITVGAAQAFDLLIRSLFPIDNIAVENPGSEPVFRLINLGGIKALPIPVDENGLCVEKLMLVKNPPKLVHVMPSHQYPTGWTMSLERRLDLLNWANEHEAYIIEDDYDSEFRFDRQPPIALAAIDSIQRVVYVGTFSKTMFPGLRLGFCILPEKLIPRVLDLKWFSDRCVPIICQLAMADWLESGLFERHIHKMRSVYAQRREALIEALNKNFYNNYQMSGVPAGVHSLVNFSIQKSEDQLINLALENGIRVYPASLCHFKKEEITLPGIIFGYGHLKPEQIYQGVDKLAKAWLS